MQRRTPIARIGRLATAAALVALVLAAPAGAASLNGGTIKLDLKPLTQKGVKASFPKAVSASKTAGTFNVGFGTATLVAQSSGTLPVENKDSGAASIKLTVGKKTLTLNSLSETLKAGKGQLTAKIGKKTVAVFDQASNGKVSVTSGFTGLQMASSNMQLTSAGATALNKALGLKKPKDLKAKQKVGSAQFNAVRLLTAVSGNSVTKYDKDYFDKLQSCYISQTAINPASAIAQDMGNPNDRGGVNLPVSSGSLRADNLQGSIINSGGIALDRPVGKPAPYDKAYHTELSQLTFITAANPPGLSAYSSLTSSVIPIGSITNANLSATLTDAGGSVTLTGTLSLADFARQALSADSGCSLPQGTVIGTVATTANVQ